MSRTHEMLGKNYAPRDDINQESKSSAAANSLNVLGSTERRQTAPQAVTETPGSTGETAPNAERNSGRGPSEALASDSGDTVNEQILREDKSRAEFLEGLKCKHCNHQAHTTSEAKSVSQRHILYLAA